MKEERKMQVGIYILATIAIMLVIIYISMTSTREDTLRNLLKDEISDSESARLEKVRYKKTGDEELWEGRINGKNLYGAYIGFHSFSLSRNRKTNVVLFADGDSKNECHLFEYYRVMAIMTDYKEMEKVFTSSSNLFKTGCAYRLKQ